MKHHIKLEYVDDGVVAPVDGEFDKNIINVGDICVFSIPDNREITCIASPDAGVCDNCVFDNSEYMCNGADAFCCGYYASRRGDISYIPVDSILEEL